ncbi:hypothetical protein NODU109028_01490 [Nocardioides dubius]|uniref:hypothetical protein n=1 Tax=Nocardioides dubius TaxID=317019 RepID=UPI0031DDC696
MQRYRQVATGAWLIAALAWLSQAFVPWASRGPLSRSTLLDLAALIQDRILVSVPRWTVGLALALPVLAAGLAVLALLRGRAALIGRWSLGLLGVGAVAVLTGALTDFETARFGTGAWLGVLGVVAVVVAICAEWTTRPSKSKTRSRDEVLS